ncbi:MAG: hypothetical protein R2827_05445 [Bdellovibrionales bacterium]
MNQKALQKLLKKVMFHLPKPLRDPMIRSQVKISYDLGEDLIIKTAETQEELESAFRLLHDAYVENQLINKNSSGYRITKYHYSHPQQPSWPNIRVKWLGRSQSF